MSAFPRLLIEAEIRQLYVQDLFKHENQRGSLAFSSHLEFLSRHKSDLAHILEEIVSDVRLSFQEPVIV